MISTPAVLWRRRALIRALTLSNLKETHRNTVLGYLWWLLDPIMMTVVYTIVIGFIRGGRQLHAPYPAFAMCGLISWKCFAGTVNQSISSVARSEGLIKTFTFPKAVLPISLVLSHHILFAFALIPLLILCLFYQFVMGVAAARVGWTLVYVPMIVLVQFTITLGVALMFSCFGVFFKDLSNIMTHILRFCWFLSPGLYAISDVIKGYNTFLSVDWSSARSLYVLNPFAHIMEGYRAAILYGRTPDLGGLAMAFALGLVSVAVGLVVFQRQERKFVKFV